MNVCPASVRAIVAEVLGKVRVVPSVPERTRELVAERVFRLVILSVPVLGVRVRPLIVVAVAAPMVGVTSVGLVAITRLPVPVWLVVVRAVPPAIESEVAIAAVPVKLAAEDIVWPFMRPEVMVLVPRLSAPEEVMGPTVRVPMLAEVEKRLVEEAVVEKRLVVVAAPTVRVPTEPEPRLKLVE